MKNNKQLGKSSIKIGRDLIGNVRIIIIILFIVFCIIIIIYHLYFESETTDKDENDTETLQLLRSDSISILHDQMEYFKSATSDEGTNDTTIHFHRPTITEASDGELFIAFEVKTENKTTIWLSYSNDATFWSTPWIAQKNVTQTRYPYLQYNALGQFRLFYEISGDQFVTVSNNGTTWGAPTTWEHDIVDKAMYYGKNYIMISNHTGLWVSNFDDDNINWRRLVENEFLNSSILRIDEYEFLIIHENSTNDHESLSLTTVDLKKPADGETIIKWDLLIVFIVIGLIILATMVQEVAHK